jgi:hypothetical protein
VLQSSLRPVAPRLRTLPKAPGFSKGQLVIAMFIFLQIVCQIALLFEMLSFLRIAFRGAAFAVSLAFLFWLPGRGKLSPAHPWAVACLILLGVEMFHPSGNSPISRLAEFVLNVAIMAPLFWVPRLALSTKNLQNILFILWSFHTVSAAVGVLQVYYPGRFQPKVSAAVMNNSTGGDNLLITLPNGQKTWRPMGLTDVPGGAATAGMYALLFSLGFFVVTRSPLIRAVALASMMIGLFCICLSQVRFIVVMTALTVGVFAVIVVRRGEISRLAALAIFGPAVVLLGFTWAVSMGGKAVSNRLESLVAASPDQIYYKNRGKFLEQTVYELLPQYPLGAGLGRWGMINYYFADKNDPNSSMIWVEIQLTGWLLDGGLPLIIFYTVALVMITWKAYQIAMRPGSDPLSLWAALILAYDVGAAAVTMNYPLFISQGGMEFWLLNGCLFATSVTVLRRGLPKPGLNGHSKASQNGIS